ncbi:hypothetical protein HG536_0G01580 [Torulaspora globosa]|uniref:TLC domain-containing protein n=1 Tax=Torulaspora globosa TaxID=48254 RepID=A0A7G3ZLB3_9SACH|nr:uncharacterized protein HG536_0G01580 [Torulaspora globosa]QLL34299.1 hypothetical protein HG536_0G01580 [Torulaspora globosa]
MLSWLKNFLLELPSPAVIQTHVVPFLSERNWIVSQPILSNLHSIVYVALFYQTCFLLGKWVVFPPAARWMHPDDRDRRRKLVIQSSVHFVSFVQSIVVLYVCFECLVSQNYKSEYPTAADRIFTSHRDTEIVCVFAIGYFLWDIYISVFYSTLPFVLHAVVSTLVFCIGLKPYIQYYAPVFLLFELSNPFLNVRWFAVRYFRRASPLLSCVKTANNLVLLVTFFGARICWGWFQIGKLVYDFYQVRHDARFLELETAIIVLGNLVLDVLNLVWFSTMISIAFKTITKKGTPPGQ